MTVVFRICTVAVLLFAPQVDLQAQPNQFRMTHNSPLSGTATVPSQWDSTPNSHLPPATGYAQPGSYVQQSAYVQPRGYVQPSGYTQPRPHMRPVQHMQRTQHMQPSSNVPHAGLLGTRYVRSSYVQMGIDTPVVTPFDDSMQGWDIELNMPIPWLTTESIGTDFVFEYQSIDVSGSISTGGIDVEINTAIVGTRIFANPSSRLRPYVGLAFGYLDASSTATPTGGPSVSTDLDSSEFVTNLGLEYDLLTTVSARADFELYPSESSENVFEGTLVWWATEQLFLRGGVLVPFDNDFSTGGVIGAGVSF